MRTQKLCGAWSRLQYGRRYLHHHSPDPDSAMAPTTKTFISEQGQRVKAPLPLLWSQQIWGPSGYYLKTKKSNKHTGPIHANRRIIYFGFQKAMPQMLRRNGKSTNKKVMGSPSCPASQTQGPTNIQYVCPRTCLSVFLLILGYEKLGEAAQSSNLVTNSHTYEQLGTFLLLHSNRSIYLKKKIQAPFHRMAPNMCLIL